MPEVSVDTESVIFIEIQRIMAESHIRTELLKLGLRMCLEIWGSTIFLLKREECVTVKVVSTFS